MRDNAEIDIKLTKHEVKIIVQALEVAKTEVDDLSVSVLPSQTQLVRNTVMGLTKIINKLETQLEGTEDD